MDGILPWLRASDKERLVRHMRKCRDAGLKTHYLIIVNLVHGRSAAQTADVVGVHRSTVYRVAARFRRHGEAGLLDRREDNGTEKLDERYLSTLYRVVRSQPDEHGWRRPTWTREMLVATLRQRTGTQIHVATMSRALRRVAARRGRPRPTVRCPWSVPAKMRRLHAIHKLLARLPRGHVAFYEDEVDIHLNPKIGWDWMVRGQQKEVMTPGQNVKRYLAGALDATTGELVWVEGPKKNSDLFVALLRKLLVRHPRATIHVVLDNYRIHDSRITRAALSGMGGRVQLHFLPPYCPEANWIERVWEDLHANVTRNHRCRDMQELTVEVKRYLTRRNRTGKTQGRRLAA